MSKIVIAGGTGFVGKFLAKRFTARGNEVLIISRGNGDVAWDDEKGLVRAVTSASVIINLAGKSVNCRYNERNKKEILRSRTETTRLLGEAILKSPQPPALWINAATATIYRHAEDRPMTEEDGQIGEGFSVNVARAWEKSFFDFKLTDTRQVALRMAIILGKGGGVMRPLTTLTRIGAGGKQGSGSQMFSWIHIEDLFEIVLFLMEHTELDGVFNCSAPNAVTNKVLMNSLKKTLRTAIALPAPAWLLRIGAVIIGTETELILKSRWVEPRLLLNAGYSFQYPDLQPALEEILK